MSGERCEILAELMLDEHAPERSAHRLIEWASVCRASGVLMAHHAALPDGVKAALCREAASRGLRCYVEVESHETDQRIIREVGGDRRIPVGVNCGERIHDWLALRRRLGVPIGYTDSFPHPWQALSAALAGTLLIAKGFTLSRTISSRHHSGLEPSEFAQLVSLIAENLAASKAALDGPEAGPTAATTAVSKAQALPVPLETLVAARALRAGTVLKRGDLKRIPELRGLTAEMEPRLVGQTLLYDRQPDEPLTFGVVAPWSAAASDAPLDVAVVMRTKNEGHWLRRSLPALLNQHHPPRDILIVDNDSSDDTVAVARSFGCRIVPIKDREFSFGRALNRGIQTATAPWVISLSAHCIPLDDRWLEAMVVRECREPFTAAVYGRQEPLPDTSDFDKRDLWTTFGEEQRMQRGQDYFFHNANSMIRREAWERIPFDESLSGVEDRDWAKKVLADGYQIVYAPLASVHHYHGIHQGRNEARARRVVRVIELIQQREVVESPVR